MERMVASDSDVPITAPERQVLDETGESPTVEVRVWRHGRLIHRELCESVEIAADIADEWSELEDVECAIDDLGAHHSEEELLEQPEGFADAIGDREHGPRRSDVEQR